MEKRGSLAAGIFLPQNFLGDRISTPPLPRLYSCCIEAKNNCVCKGVVTTRDSAFSAFQAGKDQCANVSAEGRGSTTQVL